MEWELILVLFQLFKLRFRITLNCKKYTLCQLKKPSKMTSHFLFLFFSDLTVIAGDLFSSLLTHLIVASWKSPGVLHYPVSPFVSKVVKGVSISFLLLSKTLSWVSSSLYTLRMRYWQRCRCKNFFGLNSSLSALKLFTLNIWQTVIALSLAACRQQECVKSSCSHISIYSSFYQSAIKATQNFSQPENFPCSQETSRAFQ